MAQDLGLHRQAEVIQNTESPLEETLDLLWYDEYKRRLWVKLYSWDRYDSHAIATFAVHADKISSHMAFTLGRPRAINSSDCTIKPPLDRDIPISPSKTIPTALFAHEPPSSFTPHLFQYAVCEQMHEGMTLGVHKSHIEDFSLVKTIHDRILSLINNLPPVHRLGNPDRSWDSSHRHIPKQRQQIATAAHSFLLALHRPHSKSHATSREAAIESALLVLDAQERLFDLMATQYSNIYALSVYTIDASTFLAVTMLRYPASDTALSYRIDNAIQKARHRLDLARERVPMANSALQVLKICDLKRQFSPQPQFLTPEFSVPPPSQTMGAASGEMGFVYPSDPALGIHAQAPVPSTMSSFEPSQIDSAVMFDEFIISDFDIDSWVQQMGPMDGLD